MKVVSQAKEVGAFVKPVVAIGMFDGVHRGHQQILRKVIKKAQRLKGTTVVLTFWPHPRNKPNILSLEKRLEIFASFGIKVCVVIRFNERFRVLTAKDFVEKILFKQMRANWVYVGENFRFGCNMHADAQTLQRLACPLGIGVSVVPLYTYRGIPISSSIIRDYISSGEVTMAQRLLGRPVSITGKVIKGNRVASTWGIPTANILPEEKCLPKEGVYAVRVILQKRHYQGACYIGPPPRLFTVGMRRKKTPIRIEVYIFNFRGCLYGKKIEVEFIKRIRDIKIFPTKEALVEHIKKDIKAIKKYFSS